MSSLEKLANAARANVLVVAPVLFCAWVVQNPSDCVRDYDLPMKLIAVCALGISVVPSVIRVVRRRQAGARPAGPRLSDPWTIPDLGLIAGMLLLLLFMRSGSGRIVVYDGCGMIVGPDGNVTTGGH